MNPRKILRSFLSLSLVFSLVMALLISPIRQDYAEAAGPFAGLFRVAHVPTNKKMDVGIEMLDVQRNSERFSKSVNNTYHTSFALYRIPKDVTTFDEAESYITEENRLYCVEALGHPRFVRKGQLEIIEEEISDNPEAYLDTFEENPQVYEKLKSMFWATKKDWERTGRAIEYSRLVGMQDEMAQLIVYMGAMQAKHSDWVKYPANAEYIMKNVDKDNLEMQSLYDDNHEVVRALAEAELMRLRAAVQAQNNEKTISAPGSYYFEPIKGYAIVGMTAEASNPDIILDEKFSQPLSREALRKSDDGYRLEFTIPDTLANGTYKLTVRRMDLRDKPEWTFYSSSGYEIENSAQFLGSFNMDVAEVVDEFIIKYENPNLPPAQPEGEENLDTNENPDKSGTGEEAGNENEKNNPNDLNKEPAKGDEKDPSKDPEKKNPDDLNKDPAKGDEKDPAKDPEKKNPNDLNKEPDRGDEKDPAKDPEKKNPNDLNKEPDKGVGQDPAKDPQTENPNATDIGKDKETEKNLDKVPNNEGDSVNIEVDKSKDKSKDKEISGRVNNGEDKKKDKTMLDLLNSDNSNNNLTRPDKTGSVSDKEKKTDIKSADPKKTGDGDVLVDQKKEEVKDKKQVKNMTIDKDEEKEEKNKDLKIIKGDYPQDKPGSSGKNTGKIKKGGSSPRTGDIIRSRIWMAVAVISALGLLMTEIYCKKMEKSKAYKIKRGRN